MIHHQSLRAEKSSESTVLHESWYSFSAHKRKTTRTHLPTPLTLLQSVFDLVPSTGILQPGERKCLGEEDIDNGWIWCIWIVRIDWLDGLNGFWDRTSFGLWNALNFDVWEKTTYIMIYNNIHILLRRLEDIVMYSCRTIGCCLCLCSSHRNVVFLPRELMMWMEGRSKSN